jgi:chondroitin AC lyase
MVVVNEDKIMERCRLLTISEGLPSLEVVQGHVERLSRFGTWPDIDYTDTSKAAWQPAQHLSRVRLMALALVAQEMADKEKLRDAIFLGLDNWNAKRYCSLSWWYNEIGTPRAMRDIVALLADQLKGERRKGAVDVIGQHTIKGSGANLVWSAELSLHHGCLRGHPEQVAQAAKRIWAEIKVGKGEGIQRDSSFYQHGPRLQTFHYGIGYLDVVCKLAWQLRETPYSIPKDKRTIISTYVLDGPQWMCRGIYTVPGTLDRSVSRKECMWAADLQQLLMLWRDVDPARRKELDAFLSRQTGEGSPMVGFRHYPQADFTAYHRPMGSVFLKTISERTHFSESINGENLKGVPYLNCGDHYVLRDGLEYGGLQPVWQWNHLPGLSMLSKSTRQEQKTFVGGLGNGQSGLTTMDYARSNKAGDKLSLHKSWFFHGDIVICMMSVVDKTQLPASVVSSLEQCRLRGAVTARVSETKVVGLESGTHMLDRVRWILHNNIGYVPLGMAGATVCTGKREGAWNSINQQYAKDKVEESVFQILLNHGKEPQPQGWIIMLEATSQKLDAAVNKPMWKILRNDGGCQSIQFADGLHMASFYEPGTTVGSVEVTIDKPCLAMWSKDKMWICDPTMEGREASVIWQGRTFPVRLPGNGMAEQVTPADAGTPRRVRSQRSLGKCVTRDE